MHKGWFCFSFVCVCPLCCQDDTSFDSSLSTCLIFCQMDKQLAFFPFLLSCPLCFQDDPSFDGSTGKVLQKFWLSKNHFASQVATSFGGVL